MMRLIRISNIQLTSLYFDQDLQLTYFDQVCILETGLESFRSKIRSVAKIKEKVLIFFIK